MVVTVDLIIIPTPGFSRGWLLFIAFCLYVLHCALSNCGFYLGHFECYGVQTLIPVIIFWEMLMFAFDQTSNLVRLELKVCLAFCVGQFKFQVQSLSFAMLVCVPHVPV